VAHPSPALGSSPGDRRRRALPDLLQHIPDRQHLPEDCTDRLEGGLLRRVAAGRRAVAQEQDAEVADVGLARGRVAADARVDPGDDDGVNAARAEDQLQIGAVERAEAGLREQDIAGLDDQPRVEGRSR